MSSGGIVGVVLQFAGVALLNDEIAPITVQWCTVQHIFLTVAELDCIPVRHQPIFVASEKQISVAHCEKRTLYTFAGTETSAYKLEEFALIVFAAQYVLVGPSIAEGDSLSPRRLADQISDFEIFQSVLLCSIGG